MKLPIIFYFAMVQLKSIKRGLQKNDVLRDYQETIDTDVKASYIRKLEQVEPNETRDKLQLYFPHNLVLNRHKPELVRRVCKSKQQGVALIANFRFWTIPVAESDGTYLSLPK